MTDTERALREALKHVADEIDGQLNSGILKDRSFQSRVYWKQLVGVAHAALARASAPSRERLITDARRFPLQTREGQPKSVPWLMVAGHEAQAETNHQQSLKRLAERGGLGCDELCRPRPEWCDAWLSGINDLRIAAVEAECCPEASD